MAKKAKKQDDLFAPLTKQEKMELSDDELFAPLSPQEEVEFKGFDPDMWDIDEQTYNALIKAGTSPEDMEQHKSTTLMEDIGSAGEWLGEKGMDALKWASEGIERHLEAPAREATHRMMKAGGDPKAYVSGFIEQYGEDPSKAAPIEEVFDPVFGEETIPTPATEERFTKYGAKIPAREAGEVKIKHLAGGVGELVGLDPLSLITNFAPSKQMGKLWQTGVKASGKIANVAKDTYGGVTLPWRAAKKLSGIDQRALAKYLDDMEQLDDYINTIRFDEKTGGLGTLVSDIKTVYQGRVSDFLDNHNHLIRTHLKTRPDVDVDVTESVNVLDEMIAQLDDVSQKKVKDELIRERNLIMQYFDQPLKTGSPEGGYKWISEQTGQPVRVIFKENTQTPEYMIKNIGTGDEQVISLNNRIMRVNTPEGLDERLMVSPETAYIMKKRWQDMAYGKGIPEDKVWITKIGPIKASLRQASHKARLSLHKAIPEIAYADNALSKINMAQGLVKRSIMDPTAGAAPFIRMGGEKGGFERTIIEHMENIMTDPSDYGALQSFQDAVSQKIKRAKLNNNLPQLAEEVGLLPEDLHYMSKQGLAPEGLESIRQTGVPSMPGEEIGMPSTSLVDEAARVNAALEMDAASKQWQPKGLAFAGLGTAGVGGIASGNPIAGATLIAMGAAISPQTILTLARNGKKIQIQNQKMINSLKAAGQPVVDGVLHITPDVMKQIYKEVAKTSGKFTAFTAEKAHEILNTENGAEILNNAVRAVLLKERIDDDTPANDVKISNPDQSRAYVKGVRKEAGLSNIEKFKRIQRANKEGKATLDQDMPVMAEATRQQVMPQDVFRVLKGG
jgi:hypothetical protein